MTVLGQNARWRLLCGTKAFGILPIKATSQLKAVNLPVIRI